MSKDGGNLKKAMRGLPFLGVVGLALYGGVLWYIGWDAMADTFHAVRIELFVAVMGVEALALALRAAKWRIVLGAQRDATSLFFLSKAGGNLSPARVGEFSPLLLQGSRNAQVAGWIVADRMLEVAVTLFLGAVGAFAIGAAISQSWFLAPLGLLLVIVGGVAVACFPGVLDGVLRWGEQWGATRKVAVLAKGVLGALRDLRSQLPVLLPITIVAKLLDLTVGFLLYLSLSFAVGYPALAVAQCVHGITSAVPITPNATGVPYVTAAAFLHEATGVSLEALALAVPLRVAATGLVFWSLFAVAMLAMRGRFREMAGSIAEHVPMMRGRGPVTEGPGASDEG